MIKHKSDAQKQKESVIRERLRCKVQQRLQSFGLFKRKMKEKRSCEDAPDQETATEGLNVSASGLGNDIEVSYANLVSNPSDNVSKVVI